MVYRFGFPPALARNEKWMKSYYIEVLEECLDLGSVIVLAYGLWWHHDI